MIIRVSAAGIHKDAIEIIDYPERIGFVAAVRLFIDKFPQAEQLALIVCEKDGVTIK